MKSRQNKLADASDAVSLRVWLTRTITLYLSRAPKTPAQRILLTILVFLCPVEPSSLCPRLGIGFALGHQYGQIKFRNVVFVVIVFVVNNEVGILNGQWAVFFVVIVSFAIIRVLVVRNFN